MLDGISDRGEFKPGVRDAVMRELRGHFRPEFLNRVDETVLFKPLMLEQIVAIVDLLLKRLQGRLENRKIQLAVTDEAKEFIARAAYDPVYGARPLRRYIQQRVETPLAKEIISGAIHDGQTISVAVQDEALVFV